MFSGSGAESALMRMSSANPIVVLQAPSRREEDRDVGCAAGRRRSEVRTATPASNAHHQCRSRAHSLRTRAGCLLPRARETVPRSACRPRSDPVQRARARASSSDIGCPTGLQRSLLQPQWPRARAELNLYAVGERPGALSEFGHVYGASRAVTHNANRNLAVFDEREIDGKERN